MHKTAGSFPALLCAALLAAACGSSVAAPGDPPRAPGDQPVAPLQPAKAVDDKSKVRTASLPARGLFVGDQLSEATKARLTELIITAIGLDVQVALLVPTGPWQIDGAGQTDRDLNAARLQALRRYLTDRGVNPKNIFVESRIDAKLTEPRLDVQLVGQPSND